MGYWQAALADTPIAAWRFADSSTTLAAAVGSNGTYTGTGVTYSQPGPPLVGDSTTSVGFDGSSGAASVALNLSAYSTITVEFWLNWTTYANDDHFLCEYGPDANGQDAFYIDPNGSAGKFNVTVTGLPSGGQNNQAFFTRPGTPGWHYFAVVLDRTAAAANLITPFLDGVAVSYTKPLSDAISGTFGNRTTLYFMSRNLASLFGPGNLADFAIYGSALTATQIRTHYQAGIVTGPVAYASSSN